MINKRTELFPVFYQCDNIYQLKWALQYIRNMHTYLNMASHFYYFYVSNNIITVIIIHFEVTQLAGAGFLCLIYFLSLSQTSSILFKSEVRDYAEHINEIILTFFSKSTGCAL